MKRNLLSLVKIPDLILARIYLKLFHEKKSLLIFTFHILFKNEDEIKLNHVDPQNGITIDCFRQFIDYYLNHDYSFISPNDLIKGLNVNKNHIMITFDDGYFNNSYALPILQRYKIPAVFFISTNHVAQNKCFWWDVLYRHRIKSGESVRNIRQEDNILKAKTNEEIEQFLIEKFGENALYPMSEIDRPFTPLELKKISKEKYVFIGNHTSDHAILTNYNKDGIEHQIKYAQDYIYNITGISPFIISYPNGGYSAEIINISKEIGFKLGVTVDFKKNYLPINLIKDEQMRLGRFILGDGTELYQHCEIFRSDIILYTRIENFLKIKHYQR
jgi:peptidoglycan/xylan/chitin deacetylase (PgdA/CDA1 family)